jgi:hypothetical protein
MRINFNRICKLAGVNPSNRGKLNENKHEAHHAGMEEDGHVEEGDYMEEEKDADENEAYNYEGHGMMKYEMADYNEDADENMSLEEKDADENEGEGPKDDELVEVDITELMSEIRRAKKFIKINEARKLRNKRKAQRLQEQKLKAVINREVQNVLKEMELNDHDSSWLYGKRKPRRSKKGYSAQGSFIPGIGFRKD